MSNKRINKAYVRYDGTGRVIPGSLILNRFKPKVGNWKETPAYECCNFDPCIYFTIEATEGNLNFWFRLYVIDDDGPDLTVTIKWGDDMVDTFTIAAGGYLQMNHTFSNVGFYSGTLCVDSPSRVSEFWAIPND